jgi:putative tryptophan/tyrosine transport system substrate-binding protein
VRQAARNVRVELVSLEVRQLGDFDRAFEDYQRSGADALVVDNAPFMTANASKVLGFATKNRIPTIWGHAPLVEAGGLMSYGTDYRDIYRKAGIYAAKILNGARPADLAVEQPAKYELVLNLATAKALGLSLPPAVLVRADYTVQ